MIKNAYDVKSLDRNGIFIDDLGSVQLDLGSDTVPSLPEEWLHTPQPKEWHATLLYGLLPQHVDPMAIDEVLKDWNAPDAFYSVDPVLLGNSDSEFRVIALKLFKSGLKEAHRLLSFLPHINTWPKYTPHVTVAFVKKEYWIEALTELDVHIRDNGPIHFWNEGLNYGDRFNG